MTSGTHRGRYRLAMADESFDGWAGVRDRVLALGRSPRADVVFGADHNGGHRFSLADPLTSDDLSRLEALLEVRLPEEYRQFLVEVGAGGAGPHYGITTVTHGRNGWTWPGDTDVTRLKEPFGGPALTHRLAELSQRRPVRGQFPDDGQYSAAVATWNAEEDALFDTEERTWGAINLSHQGCGYFDWLAVSGPYRGQIWTDGAAAADDFELASGSFGSWYMSWLVRAEVAVAAASSRGRRSR